MSCSIQAPTRSENIGTFNDIAYVRHHGQFVGQTECGRFAVPYQITAPANPAQGNQTGVLEPPHFTSGPIARDVFLGPPFLFGNKHVHCSVGFSNVFKRILNPNPGFTLIIKDKPITVLPPIPNQPQEVTDYGILREFALALRQDPLPFVGRIERILGIGFSDSGRVVHEVYKPFGHKLFDLTFAGTAPYLAPVKISKQHPIIVFNTEADFDSRAIANPAFPQYRFYTMAAGAHIPDAVLTRLVFTGGPGIPAPAIAGTSPINWLPNLRALFAAGEQWIREGKQPPPSATLKLNAQGQIVRDARLNALGGIRHPALETSDARFIASIVRGNGWEAFGAYSDPKRLKNSEFPQYLSSFKQATEALVAARFLLPAGGERLMREVQLRPPNTYTLNYLEGLLLPAD